MGNRMDDGRLLQIRENGGKTFSISRLNTFHTCKFEFLQNYIKHIPQKSGIYGILGEKVHDKIEECIKGNADESEVLLSIQDELDNLELLGIDFPLDRNKNPTIRNNWIKNMTRFAQEFKTPKGNFLTEELLILPIDDKNYMIGYADAIRFNSDGTVWLIDWKTGHNYTKKDVVDAGRQLVFYKKALENLGYKVKNVSWCMLKYYKATWTLKNGKIKEKVGEWRNLISDLSNTIEKTLCDNGYDEIEIECLLKQANETNKLDCMPDIIKEKINVEIYIRNYDVTEDIEKETMEYIKNTIEAISDLEEIDNDLAWEPCDIDKNLYYCSNLCGYGGSSGKCKYYQDYLATKEAQDGDDEYADLF